MVLIFGILLTLFSVYSYALVDPNLTLVSSPVWTNFRNSMVQFGYYQREHSSVVFIILLIGLFVFNYRATKQYQRINVLLLAGIAALLSIISYPFLSHDFFNYLFDAKILTVYHQNPYLHKALDFPNDPWIRFMHWTIRTYPYGPTFLPITLVPSFLALGKFFLNVVLFKSVFAGFYFMAVYYLHKIDKKLAVFFATSPLIIVEGLMNSHNDIIAVSCGIIGIYYLLNNSRTKSALFFLLSAGIKYITAPLLLLPMTVISTSTARRNLSQIISFLLTFFLIFYLSFTGEIQPWYFLNLFVFLPFFPNLIMYFSPFFTGLLLSYHPFVRQGMWSPDTIATKHYIMFVFFALNLAYIFMFLTPEVKKIVRKP